MDFPILKNNRFESILREPGDEFTAKITKTGVGSVSYKSKSGKYNIKYYPSSKTVVKTQSFKV